jgi:glutamate-1-semialdehyde 2,1-aminomutase
VPAAIAGTTIVLPFNDLGAVRSLLQQRGPEIAAVIIEPVVGNMGCVPPEPGFLQGLRELTSAAGVLLVFDEVITGLRLAPGGAQAFFGVKPDMTTLGKIIGGGLPVGVYGGRREIMERVAPLGPVYQAGTLSGNPLAMAAGLATLELLADETIYKRIDTLGAQLEAAFNDAAQRASVPLTVQRVGSMLTPFFREGAVRSWRDAAQCDTKRFAAMHQALIARGVYWPCSQYEAGFVSAAHDSALLERTAEALRDALKA